MQSCASWHLMARRVFPVPKEDLTTCKLCINIGQTLPMVISSTVWWVSYTCCWFKLWASLTTFEQGQFLPWHRWFVYTHATLLRTQCNYTGTVPYVHLISNHTSTSTLTQLLTNRWWDEALDAATGNFFQSNMWDDDTGFGGNGTAPSNCVTTGPFANRTMHIGPLEETTDYCFKRDWDNTVGAGDAAQENVDACYAYNDYLEFWECLIDLPHVAGHGGTGGVVSLAFPPTPALNLVKYPMLQVLWKKTYIRDTDMTVDGGWGLLSWWSDLLHASQLLGPSVVAVATNELLQSYVRHGRVHDLWRASYGVGEYNSELCDEHVWHDTQCHCRGGYEYPGWIFMLRIWLLIPRAVVWNVCNQERRYYGRKVSKCNKSSSQNWWISLWNSQMFGDKCFISKPLESSLQSL